MNQFIFSPKSVKVRYIATIIANIFKAGIGFVVGIIIARGLGPENYGNFNFLMGSFGAFIALLDFGTSSAFYTFLARQRRGVKFYGYYFGWILLQFAIVLLLILFVPHIWRQEIWLGQPKAVIVMAFAANFMLNKLWPLMVKIGESIRETVAVQVQNIIVLAVHLALVLFLTILHILTIERLFVILIIVYLAASIILLSRLKEKLLVEEPVGFKELFRSFQNYCAPLVLYSAVSFLYSFTDVWILQKFGGAVQQAFYSIGMRFGTVCLLATTSILDIYWKETAEAQASGDESRKRFIYEKISHSLYFITAVPAIILAAFSAELLELFLGRAYQGGAIVLSLMLLFPIHQSLGQINNVFFYATSKTKFYVRLGVLIMIISIPCTYFVLAPKIYIVPGLSLGAAGLAIKSVALQIISVNIFGYFICRLSSWRFRPFFQIKIIAALAALAMIAKIVTLNLVSANVISAPILILLIAGAIYLISVAIILYIRPGIFNIARGDLNAVLAFVRQIFKRSGLTS